MPSPARPQISLLWCAVAVVSVPFALRAGWQPTAVAVEVALAACLAVAVQAFVRRGGPAWAGLTLGTLCVTTGLVSAAGADALRPEAAHQIVSWTNAGIGAALALRFGAPWGLTALVLGMATGFAVETAAGGVIAPATAIGPVTYVLGSSLVRGAAFRGDAATERALTARQTADGALQVAEQRWEAARAVQRELHDTVLATLTLLAHRGAGVPAAAVVRACARDVELLRRGVRPPVGTDAVEPDTDAVEPGTDAVQPGAGVVQPGTEVAVANAVASAVDGVRATGFDVRVHVAGNPTVNPGDGRLAPDVAAALRDALRECLWNARRHSGVLAADVTVVVDDGRATVVVLDEGRGFDPSAVPPDRLGLRDSVTARMADAGGEATVWSGPGLGTSVLLAAPLADAAPPADAAPLADGPPPVGAGPA